MNPKKLRWSRLARERLIDIGRHISQDSPQNARKVVQGIREKARDIPPHPEAHPIVKQLPSEDNIYRFVICHSFKIIYKIKPDYILILDIFHMSRDPDNIAGLTDIDGWERANLESLNSVMIEAGTSKERQFELLAKTAISQYQRLSAYEGLKGWREAISGEKVCSRAESVSLPPRALP